MGSAYTQWKWDCVPLLKKKEYERICEHTLKPQ